MIQLLTDPAAWASLLTLTALEIVLGIDNVVFISVITSRLPNADAARARKIGLLLALGFRIALLSVIAWIVGLKDPVFSAFGQDFSWKDLILIAGGLFLIYKSVGHMHEEVEEDAETEARAKTAQSFAMVVGQIIVIDIVFSLDSIITAVGLAQDIRIMATAVILAMIVMYIAATPVSDFIRRHPTTKVLALAFLLLIGVALVADGLGFHIPRGYIYFAMAFAAGVEMINVLAGRKRARARRNKS